MAYENADVSTYTLPAATLSSSATLLAVLGPAGKVGRLVGIGAVVTTGVTDAATDVLVGSNADPDGYGTLAVPVGAAATFTNDAVINPVDDNIMPADTPVLISTGGAATAGAADVTVTIAWF